MKTSTEWTVKASLEKLMEMGMMPQLSMKLYAGG